MVSSDEKIISIAPAKCRKMNSVKILLNPIDMKKNVIIQGCEVRSEVKIIEKLKVVGLVYEGLNENQEIPLIWILHTSLIRRSTRYHQAGPPHP